MTAGSAPPLSRTRAVRQALRLLCTSAAIALAAGCGGQGDGPTPAPSPTADTPTATPTTRPTGSPPSTPPLPLGDRVTFFGADEEDSAGAFAAGDFDGDSIPDVVLTAPFADGPANARPDSGEAHIFLGPFVPGEERDPAKGQQAFTLYGARSGDQLGRALASGDFNGDGIDDIALSAPFADGPALDRPDAGHIYLLFGFAGLGEDRRSLDLAEGGEDAVIFGADVDDIAGFALHAGDVNGDGSADLIIGAFHGDGPDNARPDSGDVYVVYGGRPSRQFDLAEGAQDVTIYGAEPGDWLGEAVGAGDVNGDGLVDVIASATFADGPDNEREAAGETYIIMGPPAPLLDMASGRPDVTIVGIDPGDQIGHSIASGDVDGDGSADVILGAVSADGPGNQEDLAGEAYLILGGQSLPDIVDTAVDPVAALIYGRGAKDRLGRSAAAGDVNGDGLSDLLIAAPDTSAREGSKGRAGAVYVFLGRRAESYPETSGEADTALYGTDGGDILGHGALGRPPLVATDVNGDGLADILVTAPRADGPNNERRDSGEAYIIFMARG